MNGVFLICVTIFVQLALVMSEKEVRRAIQVVKPTCTERDGKHYVVDDRISVDVTTISQSYLGRECPYLIDSTGNQRSAEHMCFGANTTFICTLQMKKLLITTEGIMVEKQLLTKQAISLESPSMGGGHELQYAPSASKIYYASIEDSFNRLRPTNAKVSTKELVIPARLKWDDCFNHLSFQSIPLIGLVYEFYPHMFYRAHWHVSRHTAALLLLLGVEFNKLVIESPVIASSAFLPWVPYWNPYDTPSIRGIARNVSLVLTKKLLSRRFDGPVSALTPMNHLYQPIQLDFHRKERYVVYFNRTFNGTRNVDNEQEVLTAIHSMLAPSYRLVVLPSTHDHKKIRQLHAKWQQYARIINRAALLIGPHGKCLAASPEAAPPNAHKTK